MPDILFRKMVCGNEPPSVWKMARSQKKHGTTLCPANQIIERSFMDHVQTYSFVSWQDWHVTLHACDLSNPAPLRGNMSAAIISKTGQLGTKQLR